MLCGGDRYFVELDRDDFWDAGAPNVEKMAQSFSLKVMPDFSRRLRMS